MKTMALRLTTFLLFSLVALGMSAQDDVFNRDFGIGGGPGAASCKYCDGGAGDVMYLTCASAQSGDGGWQNCRMEIYPEGAYCFVDGDLCCVD